MDRKLTPLCDLLREDELESLLDWHESSVASSAKTVSSEIVACPQCKGSGSIETNGGDTDDVCPLCLGQRVLKKNLVETYQLVFPELELIKYRKKNGRR